MKKVDFLIIGQGLAGTVMSHQLIQNGHSVFVVDTKKENSASRVAAGVYNPVTYRKLKKAEFVDFILPEMQKYYPELEAELGISFFEPTSFLKLITDIEELNNWQIQSGQENNSTYMSQEICTSNFEGGIKNKMGAGQILQSGVVQLSILMDAWQKKLEQMDNYSSQGFEYPHLEIRPEMVHYQNIQAKKIIFCEGVGIVNNPWFNWLPVQQFKGEILEIHAPELALNRMVNRGVFLLPLGNGKFKVGATHDWKNVNETPTKEGRLELTEKLNKIINVPYSITNHSAGLRPASRDRHPYIGVHPKHKNIFVFNGLGSKGVIMAPWLVKEFITGIKSENWPKEFDIKRYIRFYNDSKKQHEEN